MTDRFQASHISLLIFVSLFLVTGIASAQEDIVEQAVQACEPEIESFCSQVTPGDGRLLACFVAHEDKLSGQCSWALYEAMDALETFMDAVTYLADSCWDDIVEHCSEVQMGEGRVALCLLDHKDEVTPACQEAMQEVELEAVDD